VRAPREAEVNPFASATEWLAELRAGTVTPSELTDLYISRIEKYDTRLNAVVVRDSSARARRPAVAATPAHRRRAHLRCE
jgi:amidase